MVKVRRRSFPGCQSPAIIPFLAAAAIAAAGVSCSSGVSTEEFEAVQKGLQTERAHSESLKSQLAQERACIASLEEAIYRADVTRAELETEVAKESANVAGLQKRGDEAEVRGALLAVFLAWIREDMEGFAAGFTDSGILVL